MKKILIIEDDKIVANIYNHKLQLDGFSCTIVHDGESAIAALGEHRPDAILLDLMLPKTDGLTVLKHIRAHSATRNVPVIVLSNAYSSSMIQQAWKEGATKCLAKMDCAPRQLVEIVRATLAEAAARTGPPELTPPEPAALSKPEPPSATDQFQNELRETFSRGSETIVAALRRQLQGFVKTQTPERERHLSELYESVHRLAGNSAIAGFSKLSHIATALEALLKELVEHPDRITPSSSRTVAHAIDFLHTLMPNPDQTMPFWPAKMVLILEDQPVARELIRAAVDKAKLGSLCVSDPTAALKILPDNKFDLVLADIQLPHMNGFEFCVQMRKLPPYQKTPVVFITVQDDFQSRIQSTLSGGNDFIAKPFLQIELTVKALIYVWNQ